MENQLLWLVDDDPEITFVLGLLCKRSGYALTAFKGVSPCLEAMKSGLEQPALVLLDLNLPRESGLEFLRKRGSTDVAPVALFCQSTYHRDVAEGWELGANFLFAKDLVADPQRWAERMREILTHPLGIKASLSLRWMLERRPVESFSWGRTLSRMVSSPLLRCLGSRLLAQVVCHCLTAGFGPEDRSRLLTESGRVSSQALARPASLEQVRRMFVSLIDQATRLLGTETGKQCEASLQRAWNVEKPW